MPSIYGGALKVEGWNVKFLQLNLGRGKKAQNLLMQTARERRADVLLLHPSNIKFFNFPCSRATRHTPRRARKELFQYNSVPVINYHMDRIAVRIR